MAVILLMVVSAVYGTSRLLYAKNPDLNHSHADFAIWVNGKKLDFSADKYMSSETKQPSAGKKELSRFLHLHDGIGYVIHRHKAGLTFGDFLDSLGLTVSGSCLRLDDYQYQRLDPAWRQDFAVTPNLCPTGKFHWQMYVNGVEQPANFAYLFKDGDHILFVYSAADSHVEELKQMTNDACLYSQTCLWRGKAPTEHCIADPEVPCVVPQS